ncbi:MAG TPA: peptidase E, partial [Streptosporangiaceae bacterium]
FGGVPGVDEPAEEFRPYLEYLAGLAGRRQPRFCVLTTAEGDDPAMVARVRARFESMGADFSHLALFPMPNVTDPEDFLLSRDVIFVGGGSVANMLAVWRVHGLDRVMRKAWLNGVVLSGVSAGAICWFEGGTTDSFGLDLRPFSDGLALLAGSYCPHYDSESLRRPLFTRLVADGTLPGGIACDDCAGAHFVDDSLEALVSARPGALGYRVEPDGAGAVTETPLTTRPLAGAAT